MFLGQRCIAHTYPICFLALGWSWLHEYVALVAEVRASGIATAQLTLWHPSQDEQLVRAKARLINAQCYCTPTRCFAKDDEDNENDGRN